MTAQQALTAKHRRAETLRAAVLDVLYGTVQILDAYGLGTCLGAFEAALGFGEARLALLYCLRRHGSAAAGLARQASAAVTSTVRAR